MRSTSSCSCAGALALTCLITMLGCGGPSPRASATASSAPSPPPPGASPCFPAGPALDAVALHQQFERYWKFVNPSPPPPTRLGACQVQAGEWAGELRAADGTLLAEISCGVRILVPGIRDELGLEVGGRGQDVLDRKPAPQTELLCLGNGPDQLRCEFARRDDSDVDGTSYVIAGTLGDDVLRGEAARQRLAAATLLEIHYSAWCH